MLLMDRRNHVPKHVSFVTLHRCFIEHMLKSAIVSMGNNYRRRESVTTVNVVVLSLSPKGTRV